VLYPNSLAFFPPKPLTKPNGVKFKKLEPSIASVEVIASVPPPHLLTNLPAKAPPFIIREAAVPNPGITDTASDNVSYAESKFLVNSPLSPEYSRFYGAN